MISKFDDNSAVANESHPMDFINLNFRATPYNPAIKVVEIATQSKKLDAYNVLH